jgi:hypothetical protein
MRKEQVLCVAAAVLFAFQLWSFMDRPMPLESAEPLAVVSAPESLPSPSHNHVSEADAVRGERNPFAPVRPPIIPVVTPDDIAVAPPPQRTELPPEKAIEREEPNEEANLEFAGVVMTRSQKVCLVRTPDGSSYWRLKVGDTLQGRFTTHTIEKQAVRLVDRRNVPLLLKDR